MQWTTDRDLIFLAQRFLSQKAQVQSESIDLTQVKVFKVLRADVDNDGQEEICFAAGEFVPNRTPWSTLQGIWLVDTANLSMGTIEVVEMAPSDTPGYDIFGSKMPLSGYQDLQIADINNDHLLEILSLWRWGRDDCLTLCVYQWDGKANNSLFTQDKYFPQGLVEIKDLDADGLSEIIIWEAIFDTTTKPFPEPFAIHVFHFNGHSYELQETHRSDRFYDPGTIMANRSRKKGLFGVPVDSGLRTRSIEEYRGQLDALVQSGQVDENFVVELSRQQDELWNERFYEDSLAMGDLALKANAHLSNPTEKAQVSIYVWAKKAWAFALLGDYVQAVCCYQQALAAWESSSGISFHAYWYAGIRREMALMYARQGDFEHALAALSVAQEQLKSLNLTLPENREELARLHSAFALVYFWLGDARLAIDAFQHAIAIDREQKRAFAVALNYTHLGNVLTSIGRYQDALHSYQAALDALNPVSDKDKEADIYLGMGSTLLLIEQEREGLQLLQRSLLLTSEANLRDNGMQHYLAIGEVHKRLGDMPLARQFFQRTLQLIEKLAIPEAQWQALYALALIDERDEHWQDAQQRLAEAIEVIEHLRVQYLPETLKITLFAENKARPYETMILLYCSPGWKNAEGETVNSAIESAFTCVERAKSRVFIEELSTTTITSTEGLPADLVGEEAALLTRLRSLQLRDRAAAIEQRYEWGDEIAQLEQKLQSLWHTINSTGTKGSEYIALRRATPLNFEGVKEVLKNL